MNDFWITFCLTIFWIVWLSLQLWKKEAWTYGPTYPKEKNPGLYAFFIGLYSVVLFVTVLLLLKLGREQF